MLPDLHRMEEWMLQLQNETILISFSETNGALLQLKDLRRNMDYICTKDAVPFELDYGTGFVHSFHKFSYTASYGSASQSLTFSWELYDGSTLRAYVSLTNKTLSFTSALTGETSGQTPDLIKYPLLQGIQVLRSKSPDYLFHSYATGALVQKPYEVFTDNQNGFSKMPYPECYSGCSMQFLSYYCAEKGGIYLAALDGECNVKWLNFYKENETFTFSHIYGYTNQASYPVILEFVSGKNGWYEAADKYREWAIRQEWCRKGRLADLEESQKPVWLLEKTGVTTFGINAMHDRSLWLNTYKNWLKTPVFHVTGPDWPKETQDYHNHLCGGYEDWFPTRFHPKNLKAFRDNGDFFAPFEFDFFANLEGADSENLKKSQMVNPQQKYSLDSYPFTILCPTLPYTHDLHRERDLRVQQESGCDALYYDISANNLLHLCVNPEHQEYHTHGGNREVTLGFRSIFQETKDAISIQAGKYVPVGTELMNEVFLAELDFYQARAWSQPCGCLETLYFRDWIKSGSLKIVPAFTYVYHEYGGIRMDGWGKLVEETGDLFYHTVAKTYLWGALYELNYEWSPMEAIQGCVNSPKEHYFSFTPRSCVFSAKKAEYLAQYAALRTGPANKFLAYGKMQKPLPFTENKTRFSYYHYNAPQDGPEYEDSGQIEEDTILHSIWEYTDSHTSSVGLFFANTSEQDFSLLLELPQQYRHYKNRILFFDFTPEHECAHTALAADTDTYTLNLKGRRVYFLQLSQSMED